MWDCIVLYLVNFWEDSAAYIFRVNEKADGHVEVFCHLTSCTLPIDTTSHPWRFESLGIT
jgi:hypothetical protein